MSQFLAPIPAADQELLLLFAALMRHGERGGGSTPLACEPHSRRVCAWVVSLLVGPALSRGEAEAAVFELLWCVPG